MKSDFKKGLLEAIAILDREIDSLTDTADNKDKPLGTRYNALQESMAFRRASMLLHKRAKEAI